MIDTVTNTAHLWKVRRNLNLVRIYYKKLPFSRPYATVVMYNIKFVFGMSEWTGHVARMREARY